MRKAALIVALSLAASGASAADKDKKTDKGDKAGKPVAVDLRALPRVAAAPVTVTFNVEMSRALSAEPCLTLEWEWGDGTSSVQENACDTDEPSPAGEGTGARHFTATHEYLQQGRPRVALTVAREGRTLGHASVPLIIGEPKHPFTGSFRQGS